MDNFLQNLKREVILSNSQTAKEQLIVALYRANKCTDLLKLLAYFEEPVARNFFPKSPIFNLNENQNHKCWVHWKTALRPVKKKYALYTVYYGLDFFSSESLCSYLHQRDVLRNLLREYKIYIDTGKAYALTHLINSSLENNYIFNNSGGDDYHSYFLLRDLKKLPHAQNPIADSACSLRGLMTQLRDYPVVKKEELLQHVKTGLISQILSDLCDG